MTIGIYFTGCGVGHQDFINIQNNEIGKKIPYFKFKFENTGKIVGGIHKVGYGLTHITKDKNGNLIYHWDIEEILPHYKYKEITGKCKIYEVVDPKTLIRKSWGFEQDSNPLSCRTWM